MSRKDYLQLPIRLHGPTRTIVVEVGGVGCAKMCDKPSELRDSGEQVDVKSGTKPMGTVVR
jgi:hypothetical protein